MLARLVEPDDAEALLRGLVLLKLFEDPVDCAVEALAVNAMLAAMLLAPLAKVTVAGLALPALFDTMDAQDPTRHNRFNRV